MLLAIPETARYSLIRRVGAACCAALLLGSLLPVEEAAASGPPASRIISRRATATVPERATARESGPPASRLITRARHVPVRLVSHRDEEASAAELEQLRQRSAERRWDSQNGTSARPATEAGLRPSAEYVSAGAEQPQPATAVDSVEETTKQAVSDSPLPFPGKSVLERELSIDPVTSPPAAPHQVSVASTRLAQLDEDAPAISDYTGSPDDLKRIGDILPFFDYEPDPAVLAEDPCRNLCPRPDGLSCSDPGNADRIPECPDEVNLGDDIFGGRHLPEGVLAWVAPNTTYQPLYYEDPALERYGHTLWGPVQSVVSIARFGVQTAGLPYQASLHPYCKDVYPLGWYRPGECAPKKHYQVPLSAEAAATQAAWMTGLFYLIP